MTKFILLLPLLLLTACKSYVDGEETVRPLDFKSTMVLEAFSQDFNNAMMVASGKELIHTVTYRNLPPEIAVVQNDCDQIVAGPGGGKRGGQYCPFQAKWDVILVANDTESFVFKMNSNRKFQTLVGISSIELEGTRNVRSRGMIYSELKKGQIVRGQGMADVYIKNATFYGSETGAGEFTYSIEMEVGNVTVEGQVGSSDPNHGYINGRKVSLAEFEKYIPLIRLR